MKYKAKNLRDLLLFAAGIALLLSYADIRLAGLALGVSALVGFADRHFGKK